MEESLRAHARQAPGFMPEEEGLALYAAAVDAPRGSPFLEVGSYCGKSAVYLGAAARRLSTILYSLDHHRGSEEHQAGEGFHDPALADPETGRVDTLPTFRRTIEAAGLADTVIGVLGASSIVSAHWTTPLALVFIDGGHSDAAAHGDYEGWAPRVTTGGLLVIHDVFEDPRDGGTAPHDVMRRALDSGAFTERSRRGTLRVLQRVADGI